MPNCYLCGATARTADHVPPRGLFDVVPQNIITVPACFACNSSFAIDEEYFRTTVAALAYANSNTARRVWDGAVNRSFRRRPRGLRKRLATSLVPVQIQNEMGQVVGQAPGLEVEGGRVGLIVRKIIKGIFYAQRGGRLADADLIIFRDGDVPFNMEETTRGMDETNMGEVFRFRSQYSETGGGIWIQFYRSQWWFSLTGDLARNYQIPANKGSGAGGVHL